MPIPTVLEAPAKPAFALGDWIALLKPRVMTLVVFTGGIGVLLAPAPHRPLPDVLAIVCIAAGGGAAGVVNMWYDRDIDALMRRTRRRPIPAGRIAPPDALAFGAALAAGSVLAMGLVANVTAAAALAGSIAFYVFVYTMWLKRRTPLNIVVGGAAGALPPVIGWLAAGGGLDVLPLLMFAIIFVWTPPHFWSLSLWTHADYAQAGVPMLPVTSGPRETRRQIGIYAVALVAISLLPCLVGRAGLVYGASAAALGCGFLAAAWRVLHDRQDEAGASLTRDIPARAAFRYSILYLLALFTALAVDRLG